MALRGGRGRDRAVHHGRLAPAVLPQAEAAARGASGLTDKLWLIGGNLPAQDHAALRELGFKGIFPTGSQLRCHRRLHPARRTREMNDRAKEQPEPRPVRNESGHRGQAAVYGRRTSRAAAAASGIGLPGRISRSRAASTALMYRKQPWTMRQYAGFGNPARDQPALQVPDRQRPDRAQRRLRPADADRPRFGRSAGRGRDRPRRHGGRHPARLRGRLRRHRPRTRSPSR